MQSWKLHMAGIGWSTIFGLSFLMTKGALDAFSPVALLFLRFTLASIAMMALARLGFITVRFRGKPRLPLVLICIFQPVLYFTFETFGLKEVASSTAGLVLGALPAAVAALSVPMLGERLSKRQIVGLVLSIAGVVAIVLSGGSGANADNGAAAVAPDTLKGVLLVVGALASAAFYNVFSRSARVHYKPSEATFAMMLSGAVFFGLLAIGEGASRGWSAMFGRATLAAWGSVVYLGLLSSVLAFFLVNLSLARLKASQASVFGTLTTLVSLVAGIIFRGESFGLREAMGAACIVTGVWMTNAKAR